MSRQHLEVEHLFRSEYSKAVSYLTGRFGPGYLEAAEDAVQDALIKAMQTWPFHGQPDNPTGWIIRTATNKLIDHLRRQQKVCYATQLPEEFSAPQLDDDVFSDELIKMVFACCSPSMSIEYQLVLTLKILGGLSVREIATALLKKEETVAKAYTRAKKKFKQENIKLELPPEQLLPSRLQAVTKVIYLLFNEGYKSAEGDQLIRKDLCEEAMRLNHLILGHSKLNNEHTRALMALMHYQVARFDARIGEDGCPISLEDQDRKSWDRAHIQMGDRYLATIKQGQQNEYFLQAAIAGLHASASSYADTNWTYIHQLYEALYKLTANPIIKLNSIIPCAEIHGPAIALAELTLLENDKMLQGNFLVPATRSELYFRMGDINKAISEAEMALKFAVNKRDQLFLSKKVNQLINRPTSKPM